MAGSGPRCPQRASREGPGLGGQGRCGGTRPLGSLAGGGQFLKEKLDLVGAAGSPVTPGPGASPWLRALTRRPWAPVSAPGLGGEPATGDRRPERACAWVSVLICWDPPQGR